MIDFLKQCDVSDAVIKRIYQENASANIYNLSCNQDEVVKIINYLKELGLSCIEELLIYRIDIFFMNSKEIMEKFSNDTDKLVQLINEDYMNIDNL